MHLPCAWRRRRLGDDDDSDGGDGADGGDDGGDDSGDSAPVCPRTRCKLEKLSSVCFAPLIELSPQESSAAAASLQGAPPQGDSPQGDSPQAVTSGVPSAAAPLAPIVLDPPRWGSAWPLAFPPSFRAVVTLLRLAATHDADSLVAKLPWDVWHSHVLPGLSHEAFERRLPRRTSSASWALHKLTCTGCGDAPSTMRCPRCKRVPYCSARCARAHWATHRESCQRATVSKTLDALSAQMGAAATTASSPADHAAAAAEAAAFAEGAASADAAAPAAAPSAAPALAHDAD